MFAREKSVRVNGREYTYVQIVENRREGRAVRQRMLMSLGNRDDLDPGAIDRLMASLARYGSVQGQGPPSVGGGTPDEDDPGVGTRGDRSLGDVAALDAVWREYGFRDLVRRLARQRRFRFDVERAVFAMVANRLIDPSSKLRTETWLDEEAYLPLQEALTVDHLYKALCWLYDAQEDIEVAAHRLLKQRRLTGGTVYFYDTTLTYFEGQGPASLARITGRRGARKGKRHLLVGLVTTSDGWPVMHHVYPGATNDVPTFKQTLRDLHERFGLREIVIICDRGMHSEDVIRLLDDEFDYRYIVATRLRKVTEIDEDVLSRGGRYREVEPGLEVKEVWVEDRRYVVCRSRDSAERDQRRRAEILAELTAKLGTGLDPDSKAAMKLRTSAYDRFLTVRDGRLVLDEEAIARDSRYDGKWVLRTNLRELDPARIALRYKDESRIERDLRTIKSFVGLRPIHHREEPWVAGHVVVCVLALLLHRAVQAKLGLWPASRESVEELLRKLARVRAHEHRVGREGEAPTYFWSRSDLTPDLEQLLRRFGVSRLPRRLDAPPRLTDEERARTESRRHRRKKAPRRAAAPDEEVLR